MATVAACLINNICEMEQLNRIELRGSVGSVKIQTVAQGRVAHFTLATNYAYKDKNGGAVIETTWHNVTAWEGKSIPSVEIFEKGSKLYVCGRLRNQKYLDSSGVEHSTVDVQAQKVQLLEDTEPFQSEF